MRHAAKHGLTFHLWWHPHNIGVNTERNLQQLDEICAYYSQLKEKYGMRSLNMGEAAEEIFQIVANSPDQAKERAKMQWSGPIDRIEIVDINPEDSDIDAPFV